MTHGRSNEVVKPDSNGVIIFTSRACGDNSAVYASCGSGSPHAGCATSHDQAVRTVCR